MNNITMTLQVDHLIMEALREDISSEDVTTNAVMHEAVTGEVDLICKQDGVIAGLQIFQRVFELLDKDTKVEFFCKDGDEVKNGQLMGKVTGDIRVLSPLTVHSLLHRHLCTPFRRKSCAELSAENEWNRKLYTFRSIASGGK